jgi:predicted metalloprotease with PDZ domain
MVPDRRGHSPGQLQTGKGDFEKSQADHFDRSGEKRVSELRGPEKTRQHLKRHACRFLFIPAGLAAVLVLWPAAAAAQGIYAENQVPARGVEIEYNLTIRNPISHIFDIEMIVRGLRNTSIDVALPAWQPGDYTIRDFAKNVQDFRATTGRGQPLQWQQADKLTWRIAKPQADDVTLHYQIFSARLTDELADVAPPSLFMYVVGQKHVPVSVKYNASGWKTASTLEKRGDRYYAPDYDVFVDAAAFIGPNFKTLDFEVDGIAHRLVFSKPDISIIDGQITSDVKDIVNAAHSVFPGKLPYKEYTFLVRVQPGTGSDGLDHLSSSRLTIGENDFVSQVSYRRFLFVVAQQYFHLWNGKRIRPKVLGPFDYTREANTSLLWFVDGVTNYYADLLLTRADIGSPLEFQDKIGTLVNTLQHAPGRLLMSVQEAAFKAWNRSDNADNAAISYADKGEIVALLLDLEIRGRTRNAKSLDDVMRYLKANYADKGVGFSDDGVLKAVEAVAGSDFNEFFELTTQSRKELDYNRYLKHAGWQTSIGKQPGTIFAGIEYERNDAGQTRVRRVVPGSPAEKAKLDAGDVLVAMNNERLTYENFRIRLHSHRLGETIKLTLMRGERMLTADLTPVEFQQETWTIAESPEPTAEQTRLRNTILGIPEKR